MRAHRLGISMFNVDINNSRQTQPPVFTSINYEISKQELLNAKDTGRSDEKQKPQKICKQPAKIMGKIRRFKGGRQFHSNWKLTHATLHAVLATLFSSSFMSLRVFWVFFISAFLEDVHSLTLVLNCNLFVTISTEQTHAGGSLSQHVRKKQSVRYSAGNLT